MTTPSQKLPKWGALLICAIFFFTFLAAHFWLKSELKLHYHLEEIGVSTTAEVVDIYSSKNEKSRNYTYSPIVAYEVAGKKYKLQSILLGSKNDFPDVGGKMPILYNPQKPQDAIFVGEYGEKVIADAKTTSWIFLGASLLSVVAGVVFALQKNW